jgi:hypothetical protein
MIDFLDIAIRIEVTASLLEQDGLAAIIRAPKET